MRRQPGWQLASIALAIAGIAVAAYLTVVHYDARALVCQVGNCRAVQSSRYAEVAGIPVALLGLGMYATILALGALRWRPERRPAATMAAFTIAVAGTVYAAYLTYLEIAVIHAVCQWCVVSALVTVGILLMEGLGVYRLLVAEPPGEVAGSGTAAD